MNYSLRVENIVIFAIPAAVSEIQLFLTLNGKLFIIYYLFIKTPNNEEYRYIYNLCIYNTVQMTRSVTIQ